jgi:transposase
MKTLGIATRQQLAKLRKLFVKEKRIAKPPAPPRVWNVRRLAMYRTLTQPQRQLIVDLHEREGWTKRQISQRLKVNISTVYGVLRVFEKDGTVASRKSHCGRRPTQKTLAIMRLIQQPQVLKDWMHLTLRERCLKIEQLLGYKIYSANLRLLYLKVGVRYRKAKINLLSNKRSLEELRLQ